MWNEPFQHQIPTKQRWSAPPVLDVPRKGLSTHTHTHTHTHTSAGSRVRDVPCINTNQLIILNARTDPRVPHEKEPIPEQKPLSFQQHQDAQRCKKVPRLRHVTCLLPPPRLPLPLLPSTPVFIQASRYIAQAPCESSIAQS